MTWCLEKIESAIKFKCGGEFYGVVAGMDDKLDFMKVDPYPIQFANVDRIENNEIVYIFDETGSGKTISTGLMAMHYLYNHSDKEVLILTIPALKSSGQFRNDWLEKLPFEELKFGGRFTVENDVDSNIEKLEKKERKQI